MKFASVSLLLILTLHFQAAGAIEPAEIFGEHMVLQAGKALRFWGTGTPGEEVKLQFRGETYQSKVEKDGSWVLMLPKLEAGQGSETLRLNEHSWKDILVGEVWLGSGQSNIFLPAKAGYFSKDERLHTQLATQTPLLRMYEPGEGWRTGKKEEFSALMGGFGHQLYEELGVPVGLIVFAQGGSSTRPWMTWDMLLSDPYASKIIEEQIASYPERLAAFEQSQEEKKPGWRAKKLPRNPDYREKDKRDGKGHHLGLHYARIAPMAGYSIRGVLWDQGESNDGIEYLSLMDSTRVLINGWRRAWGDEELPWILIQKPSGGGCAYDDENPITAGSKAFSAAGFTGRVRGGNMNWMARTIQLSYFENIYNVSTSDLCTGLHPWNKWGYAQRAAGIALSEVYSKDKGAVMGPRYAGHEVDGSSIVVRFDSVGQGLEVRHDEKLLGFFLGDEGSPYLFPAEAVIDGNTVRVSSSRFSKPTRVAYYWTSRRTGSKEQAAKNLSAYANLFNRDGHPAWPFSSEVMDPLLDASLQNSRPVDQP